MKIERLGADKVRIFLTFDDLTERGIQKDDMWREIPKVHELFSEMMEQAHSEVGFDASGPLAVEVFALPAQGMVVIVSRSKMSVSDRDGEDTLLEEDEEVFEMEVTLEQSEIISYLFHDFEELVRMSQLIQPLVSDGGKLFNYKNKWILQLDPAHVEDEGAYQAIIAVMSEFGEATSVTQAVLEEYGKTVISANAIQVLCTHFK